MERLHLKYLHITFKFNFTERTYVYDLTQYTKRQHLFDTICKDAECFVHRVCGRTSAKTMDRYSLLLYRLDEHTPYLHLITDYYGLENECIIQIVPIECSKSERTIEPISSHITPQPCGKCQKFIAGEMLDNAHWCKKCRIVYHQSCAPTFSHQCNQNDLQRPPPIPLRNRRITRHSIKNPSGTTVQDEQIDNANLLYFINYENIYRRGHFIVTRSELILHTHAAVIRFDEIKLVRFVYDKPESHTFEIICYNGTIICIGHGHQSSPMTDEIRLITDQFCSHVHLQWESLKTSSKKSFGSTKSDKMISEYKRKLVPIGYQYGPEDESNDHMQELYEFTYEIIGQGSFGTVEAAIRRSTRQPVAVKRIDYTKWQEQGRTSNEIDILYQLKHPSILTFQSCFSRHDGVYIFTERMEFDLFDYITKPPNLGRLRELTSKYIIYQILVAVSYLHQKNICHCDIKPENLLLNVLHTSTAYKREHVKLADFGMSKYIRDTSLRRSQVGTRPYMAPELYHSYERGYNKSADLWAVGIVLYACLSGCIPFDPNEIDKAEHLVNNFVSMYPYKEWKHISDNAISFLSKNLLVADPTQRTKAEKNLSNKWFTDDRQLRNNLRELEIMIKMDNEPYWLTKYLS
ncbi:unnamed protein product [Adineta steineri]|uniref:Protein kinase domain-containing protein n=1 Tax=Adineta steineri TaxID=433720 RepID=A0A815II54_9BILA|nr:unnamed protein product [Adineta steineri]